MNLDFSHLVDKFIQTDNTLPDILSFIDNTPDIEAPYPGQRFLLKLIYGLPLDNEIKNIRITDKFNEKVEDILTEEDYFKFLVESGRINIKEPPTHPIFESVWVVGRRGGKSILTSTICDYELAKLLFYYEDPHDFFKISRRDTISVVAVATKKPQAQKIFEKIVAGINRLPNINDLCVSDTKSSLEFMSQLQLNQIRETPKEILAKELSKKRASLSCYVEAADSKTGRGSGSIVLVFDELAHFRTNEGVRSCKEIYNAMTPSVTSFGLEGKIISISSPWTKEGQFYELYSKGMVDNLANLLVIQMPTWGLNPKIDPNYLKNRYSMFGEQRYNCEFGAVFLDAEFETWIKDVNLVTNNVIKDKRITMIGNKYDRYCAGFDVGVTGDGFAVAIGHKSGDKKILDYSRVYYSQEKERQRYPYSLPHYEFTGRPVCHPTLNRISYRDVVEELSLLSKKFPLCLGLYDQYCGYFVDEFLKEKHLHEFVMRNFTEILNSNSYVELLADLTNGIIEFYDECDLPLELLTLKVQYKTGRMIKVEAPRKQGCHDDISDAFVRMNLALKESKDISSAPKIIASGMSNDRIRRQLSYNMRHQGYSGRKM